MKQGYFNGSGIVSIGFHIGDNLYNFPVYSSDIYTLKDNVMGELVTITDEKTKLASFIKRGGVISLDDTVINKALELFPKVEWIDYATNN